MIERYEVNLIEVMEWIWFVC